MTQSTHWKWQKPRSTPPLQKDQAIDFIYPDSPFTSYQDYNILFAEGNGSRSEAQIRAFEDTWH